MLKQIKKVQVIDKLTDEVMIETEDFSNEVWIPLVNCQVKKKRYWRVNYSRLKK